MKNRNEVNYSTDNMKSEKKCIKFCSECEVARRAAGSTRHCGLPCASSPGECGGSLCGDDTVEINNIT